MLKTKRFQSVTRHNVELPIRQTGSRGVTCWNYFLTDSSVSIRPVFRAASTAFISQFFPLSWALFLFFYHFKLLLRQVRFVFTSCFCLLLSYSVRLTPERPNDRQRRENREHTPRPLESASHRKPDISQFVARRPQEETNNRTSRVWIWTQTRWFFLDWVTLENENMAFCNYAVVFVGFGADFVSVAKRSETRLSSSSSPWSLNNKMSFKRFHTKHSQTSTQF